MTSLLDRIVGVLRPVPLRGKGFLLHLVTPQSGTRTVPVWGPYRMSLDLSNAINRQIFMGCFSRHIVAALRALLPRGGTFLDVGAHIGYFSLLAARLVGPEGRVLAVEPNPGSFQSLEGHIQANQVGNLEARRLALSDAAGVLRLYLPPEGRQRDYNITSLPRPDWTPLEVPCRRLDDCLAEWGVTQVDLMKIDVEGSEPKVLAGAAEALGRGVVRHLIAEVNGPRLSEAGSSPAQLVAQLAELGFAPARLSGGRAIPVPKERWDLDPAHEYDRLFVHRARAQARSGSA